MRSIRFKYSHYYKGTKRRIVCLGELAGPEAEVERFKRLAGAIGAFVSKLTDEIHLAPTAYPRLLVFFDAGFDASTLGDYSRRILLPDGRSVPSLQAKKFLANTKLKAA